MRSGLGEPDRVAGQPVRGRVHQDLPGRGNGLHARGGVHRVPGDHPLTHRTQADRYLARHHACPGRQARHRRLGAQRLHRGHQVQRRADGALRVPFGRGRGAPHRHHRVPDELLDRSPVAADDRPGHGEVLREQFAHGLGVPRLRQRGESHDVAEQHRAHPPLGHRVRAVPGTARGGRPRGRGAHELGYRRTAGTAKTLAGSERITARRARADGCPAVPAETVALSHRRTALPARHATVLTLVP
jgi:hypothetical protein